MTAGCDWCDTPGVACQNCVVAVVGPSGAARHLGVEEVRALAVLADAGMLPATVRKRGGDAAGAVIKLPKRRRRNEVVGVKRTA